MQYRIDENKATSQNQTAPARICPEMKQRILNIKRSRIKYSPNLMRAHQNTGIESKVASSPGGNPRPRKDKTLSPRSADRPRERRRTALTINYQHHRSNSHKVSTLYLSLLFRFYVST